MYLRFNYFILCVSHNLQPSIPYFNAHNPRIKQLASSSYATNNSSCSNTYTHGVRTVQHLSSSSSIKSTSNSNHSSSTTSDIDKNYSNIIHTTNTAAELAVKKYCSVHDMLVAGGVEVIYSFEIN